MEFGYAEGVPWREKVLRRIGEMDAHLESVARAGQRPAGDSRSTAFAKFPGRDFNYLEELDAVQTDRPASEEELLDEIAGFFRGAQRPDSPYCLFNMNVLPTVDATAAASLALMRNVNYTFTFPTQETRLKPGDAEDPITGEKLHGGLGHYRPDHPSAQ
jgi:hypothetical protein